MNAREKAKTVFALLRKHHSIIARMNYWCCSSCAGYALGNAMDKRGIESAVYWHSQDEEYYQKSGRLTIRYFSNVDTTKLGQLIYDLFILAGVKTEWTGKATEVIYIFD